MRTVAEHFDSAWAEWSNLGRVIVLCKAGASRGDDQIDWTLPVCPMCDCTLNVENTVGNNRCVKHAPLTSAIRTQNIFEDASRSVRFWVMSRSFRHNEDSRCQL